MLGEREWEGLARGAGASRVDVVSRSNLALAVAAAEAFLDSEVDPAAAETVQVPGRLEHRSEHPLEIWDGAHNLAGVGYLLRAPAHAEATRSSPRSSPTSAPRRCCARSRRSATRFVATTSGSQRATPPEELANLARPHFARVEAESDPAAALARARTLAGPDGAILVTGSLYLLAALSLGG